MKNQSSRFIKNNGPAGLTEKQWPGLKKMRRQSKPSSKGGLSVSFALQESKMAETCTSREKKYERRHVQQRKDTDQWLKI